MKMTDDFAAKGLPPKSLQPHFLDWDYGLPLTTNAADGLLEKHLQLGLGDRIALRTHELKWTYQELSDRAARIAHVLRDDFGIVPGNRVMLRSANTPMAVACWFGILKAGAICVATMPLLRSKELSYVCDTAEISLVLCQENLMDDCVKIQSSFVKRTVLFGGDSSELERLTARKPATFESFVPEQDSVAIISFTSGTTGSPKMTAHYHRDLLAICTAFPEFALQVTPDDIFCGSPPLAFTFGLGGLVLFPMFYGASTFLIERPAPDIMLSAIQEHRITVCFTAPTAWRIMGTLVSDYDVSSLRRCVSAGETLPLKIWQDWKSATGIEIIDGIGATEMLHIFISSRPGHIKPGATGQAISGYEARIIGQEGEELPDGQTGRLAVRGITGCKYLNNPEKQKAYVHNGWNITGDLFRRDADGYFWFVARGDDMIISSGYNISAIEVESTLLEHPDVAECAVIGVPDEARGMIVCAHIVLRAPATPAEETATGIQQWFKQNAAPYKYPRQIVFTETLPKTETGKMQRFKLKQQHA